MLEQKRVGQSLTDLRCKKHPEALIRWVDIRERLDGGAQMVLEKPICIVEDKPHGFILPWMEPLKDALDKIALPPDLQIEVRRRPNGSAALPPGTYELKAGTVRKLYLPSATQEAIDRMRRRIEYAPTAYDKHSLAAITDMRLNAIFFGPPGTGKSSAFLDVTEGLIQQRLSVSLTLH